MHEDAAVSRITYTVLVETLNPAQSNPVSRAQLTGVLILPTVATAQAFGLILSGY